MKIPKVFFGLPEDHRYGQMQYFKQDEYSVLISLKIYF